MRYVECPEQFEGGERSLFLAGGVTGCPNWQAEVASALSGAEVTLVNPRRKNFLIADPAESEGQIVWEHRALRLASAILFWFPEESLCPISLYELGAWSMSQKPLFVGVHPQYKRRIDVEIQTRLVRPDVGVKYSLTELTAAVERWISNNGHD